MRSRALPGILAALMLSVPAAADLPAGQSLVDALRDGGYVIYFRHAATEWSQQDRVEKNGDWRSCDSDRMRQLSEDGLETARDIGQAFRRLGIPVSQVLSSEYCRARQTAEALDLGPVQTTTDIMNLRAAAYFGGREAVTERARKRLSEPPAAGTNTVVVGHGNLMQAATGTYTGEAGAGVFRPRPGQAPELVGEVTPDTWTDLAEAHDRPDR